MSRRDDANRHPTGFGHIAVNVDDVYKFCEDLEKHGFQFKKKPDEGRMKGLAFLYDPDRYWVEIVKRGENHGIANRCNFSQTMLRVRDPQKSIDFYKRLGMIVLQERHFDDFSLYFLASGNIDPSIEYKNQFQPVLELTHNHGTEKNDSFKHYNGNEQGRQGFGHIGKLLLSSTSSYCTVARLPCIPMSTPNMPLLACFVANEHF